MRTLTVFFSVLFAVQSSAEPIDSNRFAQLDHYLETQVERFSLPGLAVAVVSGDRIAHLRAFGEEVSADSAFLIGSCSKSFTGLAALLAAERGLFRLDQPIDEWVGPLAYSRWEGPIRVRDLLEQTSGLIRRDGFIKLPERGDWQEPLALRLDYAPGTSFSYCNLNYALLGSVIEQASGQSFSSFLQDHVLDPLGLESSYGAERPADVHAAPGFQYWFGVPVEGGPVVSDPTSIPSGYIRSSARDLGTFLLCQINGGRHEGKQVFPQEIVESSHTPGLGREFGYGRGWSSGYLEPYGRLVYHDGAVETAYAAMGFFPDRELGIALLTNINLYDPLWDPGEKLFKDVIRILHGDEPSPPFPYRIWATRALLILFAYQLFGGVRWIVRWNRSGRKRKERLSARDYRALLVTLIAPVVLFTVILRWTEIPLRMLFRVMPDVGYGVIIMMIFSVVVGCLQIVAKPERDSSTLPADGSSASPA